ncbi:MAG: hypothetical protein JEZ09_14900 [Salinivirgaceae bacterium]|nr:hypothetical protein [Salinivirgaceae bacterium]
MRIVFFWFALTILIIVQACVIEKGDDAKGVNSDRLKYANLLNVKNVPDSTIDWHSFCFSDQGAWFGFALPAKKDTNYYGAFTGPFLMTEGKWLSKSLLNFELFDNNSNQIIDFSNATIELNYLPGVLIQSLLVDDLELELALIFANDKSALINYKITNRGEKNIELTPKWKGELFSTAGIFKLSEDKLLAFSKNDSTYFHIDLPFVNSKYVLNKEKKSYQAIGEKIILTSNKTFNTYASVSFNKIERINDPRKSVADNTIRWNAYINKTIATTNAWGDKLEYQKIAVKALNTLVNNWRKPYGHLYHQGLFPSYAVDYFNGFWAWDSWKHAVALAVFEPELAKDQIRTMFDYQNAAGMVADCIYADSSENNWLNTKPPLATWAVYEVFQKTQDTSFVKEMFSKLEKYHKWWYLYRDYNKNSLCEYGSSDQSLVAAKWESGMDNAIRFDNSNMIQIDKNNWAFNQESVDLNCYLFQEKTLLKELSLILNFSEKAKEYQNAADKIQLLINLHFYDEESGYFYDLETKNNLLVKIQGPEGWSPLFTKTASNMQAQKVMRVMMDTTKFASYIPFPTASISENEFSSGYWRGPIWLDQTYFAIASLVNYGKGKEAQQYTYQVFDRLEGLKGDAPIRENYWPFNGRGMRVNHFSWSAAHLLMLYQMDYKDKE